MWTPRVGTPDGGAAQRRRPAAPFTLVWEDSDYETCTENDSAADSEDCQTPPPQPTARLRTFRPPGAGLSDGPAPLPRIRS
ncbi:hypothetical protein HPB47_026661 [Ixodes persulcatus]|uniref:Uncharacterized protein n=1 Tax=Ixodes persulcatus TaxID=34615 RepID=A0AC60PZZ8_IXOPE|nr:hypothetical protein HPB47_026661 [Ixodes persulcatus]